MPSKRTIPEMISTMDPSQKTWTRAQAAFYLNIGISTFDRLDIPFIKIGRTVRFFKEDLDAFLLQHFKEGKK